jgi:hypothetical protein
VPRVAHLDFTGSPAALGDDQIVRVLDGALDSYGLHPLSRVTLARCGGFTDIGAIEVASRCAHWTATWARRVDSAVSTGGGSDIGWMAGNSRAPTGTSSPPVAGTAAAAPTGAAQAAATGVPVSEGAAAAAAVSAMLSDELTTAAARFAVLLRSSPPPPFPRLALVVAGGRPGSAGAAAGDEWDDDGVALATATTAVSRGRLLALRHLQVEAAAASLPL